jgi:hypothetical protein
MHLSPAVHENRRDYCGMKWATGDTTASVLAVDSEEPDEPRAAASEHESAT